MEKIIEVNYNNIPIYDIILSYDYSDLGKAIKKFDTNKKKVCIVSDSTVSSLYMEQVKEALSESFLVIEEFVFQAGEQSKNLDTVYQLYEHLIQHNFDRKDFLIALGGGVVGDLTGYAAATYLRGIQFIQMPTSLLAMVDSSIGGKTGVDFHAYKNMIGAFHQPSLVYMNLSTLQTLTERQYFSGLGEIIKHGLIKDAIYYNWLKENQALIQKRELKTLLTMVYGSCLIKKEVVEKDPKELGDRALLNFGHTIGHAVEKTLDFEYLHGECIGIGMVAASYISYRRGNITIDELQEITNTIQDFKLPISINYEGTDEIVNTTTYDKKMESGKLKFIVLSQIGNAIIDTTISPEEIQLAVNYIVKEK